MSKYTNNAWSDAAREAAIRALKSSQKAHQLTSEFRGQGDAVYREGRYHPTDMAIAHHYSGLANGRSRKGIYGWAADYHKKAAEAHHKVASKSPTPIKHLRAVILHQIAERANREALSAINTDSRLSSNNSTTNATTVLINNDGSSNSGDSSDSNGRWITIGGRKNKDGERVGGGPRVFIKDGKILWGQVPKNLRDTAIGDFRRNIRQHAAIVKSNRIKAAHTMTSSEWSKHLDNIGKGVKSDIGPTEEHIRVAHQEMVRQALRKGKRVPKKVKDEYLERDKYANESSNEPSNVKEPSRDNTSTIKQRRGKNDLTQTTATTAALAGGITGTGDKGRDSSRSDSGIPSSKVPTSDTARGTHGKGVEVNRIPASLEEVNDKLDRHEAHFRSKGSHHVADLMKQIKEHVNQVGPEEALNSLKGIEGGMSDIPRSARGRVRYEGEKAGWEDIGDFGKDYLARHGITSVYDKGSDKNLATISSLSPAFGGKGGRGNRGDFQPRDPKLIDKLQEAKHLPGLSKAEDINVLMGKPVTHLTKDVTDKLDEHYGKGDWIVKTYGEDAFGGRGIYFPQKAERIKRDAQSNLWSAGSNLAKYGFSHLRDKDNNDKVVGIKHANGDEYKFGTKKYNDTIKGDARHWGDISETAASDERGAELPFEGKDFMAQPAFPVVGISDEERAQGMTIKKGLEGRTHVATRKGKAYHIPHSTWLKAEPGQENPLPVVFENDDTRSMAKAAVDAINHLPESERRGQIYAPDIVKTKDGYKVVEANPSNYSGPSGYLGDNPYIIDSYVSHLTGREPGHVQFIRKLLTKRGKKARAIGKV